MIGFYLTKTGEYNPAAVADISSAIILDDHNKKMQVMGEYNFDFQRLDASYTSTVDASAKGLSIYGAGLMYNELLGYVDDAVQAWIPDASRTAYNTAAVQTHTHSNKDILDGITDASVEDWIRDTSYEQGTLAELNSGVNTTAKVWDASTIHEYVDQTQANAVRFRGDFNAETGVVTGPEGQTLDQLSEKKGDMFVVSTAGTYLNHEMQVGDSIIFKSACGAGVPVKEGHLAFVQGVVKAVAENPTLTWDTSSKIGEVEGVDFYVKMPAMPTKSELGLGNVENKSAATILSELSASNVSTALGFDPVSASDIDASLTAWIPDASRTAYNTAATQTHTHSNKDILDGLTDTSISNWNDAYSWGDHSLAGYALDADLIDLSTNINARVAEVSAYEIDLSTNINERVAEVSAYSIDVSVHNADVSTFAHNVNTSVNTKFNTLDASMQNIFNINSE